ncbi:MAG: tRNA (adenosine(37)-N6)-threonylcarbamoyltransferase complex ATPase subunit type 1 TsaE [Akkermansiaceae bacterium]|jgi:tRNA threonylcarbamoyladenosine biosynthesis protein TsaE|nr:tRNA (adenosine(37)-N6)-threonylcarbamoyltransferase complex ATPase subunit type 1 TsaE [Akkermansiaceae bacterium]
MERGIANEGEMIDLGRELAAGLMGGDVIALVGGLGAGKTHLTKGIAAGLGCQGEVTSPTFSLVHEYAGGRLPMAHLDFYRLESAAELVALGWDELIDQGGVVVAEWADRFPEMMPENTRWLRISPDETGGRRVLG